MSERREWVAADAPEIRRMLNYEPADDALAIKAAEHFGWEVQDGIPEGAGYWSLEPSCVLGRWVKRPGSNKWECLNCYGISMFDEDIKREFFARLEK